MPSRSNLLRNPCANQLPNFLMSPHRAFIGSSFTFLNPLNDSYLLDGIRKVCVLRQPPNRVNDLPSLAHTSTLPERTSKGNRFRG